MEKCLKKAKFRSMTLADETVYQAFAKKMPQEISACMRFAFINIWRPFAKVYIRETERFLLIAIYDELNDHLYCMPPLGDWQTYSLARPVEAYLNLFRAAGRKFVMTAVSEWMLPALCEAGLDEMQQVKDADESDCMYMAQDYALSLMREQTKADIEKLSSAQNLQWIDYAPETHDVFCEAFAGVYDKRFKKLDKEALYENILSLTKALELKLCMLRGDDNILGLFGFRIVDDEMELFLYYAAMRPKYTEATVRKAIGRYITKDVRRIFLTGSYHTGSLIAGKQPEIRSTQMFNYNLREK